MKKLISIALILLVSGCASKSKNIDASYVSPLQYQDYSCEQVGQEMGRVGRKLSDMSTTQDSTATKDTVAMTVGLIVFWPSLFFLATGNDNKVELARLKGENDALESIAIEKNCSSILASIEAAKQRQAEIDKVKKEKEAQENINNSPGA